MATLTENLALALSEVNIVRSRNRSCFADGFSLTAINFRDWSSSSSYYSLPNLASRRIGALSGRRYSRSRAPVAAVGRDQRQQQQLEGEGKEVSSDMAASDPAAADDRIARITAAIRVIPDFPKPGIMFQDITTLLLDPKAFKDTIDLFVERYKDKGISVVAGVEARGFIFGPPIALAIGAKFVPMRKPKKLPGEVISEEYSLEYGTDKMEMHVGAVQEGERALVIDDLIATGGTLCAAIRLLERVGVHVVECACVIELPELKGRDRLGEKPLFVLVSSA